MLLKVSLISLVLCLLASCKNAPQVTVYVVDVNAGGMDGYDEATKQTSFLEFKDTEKFVCFNPADASTLINFCGAGSK